MTRKLAVIASTLSTFGFLTWACTSGEVVMGPPGGTGASSQQGSAGTGNPTGSAGTTGAGNVVGSAGTTGSAGNVASRGGTTGAAGNVTSRGGTTGQGNTTGQAGTTGTGNTTGQAGTTGAGGTGTGACAPTFDVASNGYVQAPAASSSCWHGFAAGGGDAGSSLTPKDFSACGMPCMLKLTGTLNAATMANTYAGYAYLGFNVGQDASSTTAASITPKGASVTATFTITPSTQTVRAQITDSAGGLYCAPATSGTAIPYGSFTKECYNAMPGAAYSPSAGMTAFQLSIPGGATSQAITVTLTSVKEN